MAEIRIKVGASLDPSLDGVLGKLDSINRRAASAVMAKSRADVAQARAAQEAARLQLAVYKNTQRYIQDGEKARLATKLATLKAETSAMQAAAKVEVESIRSAAKEREKAAREAARLARSSGGVVGASFGGGRGGPNVPYRMGYWSMRNFSATTPTLNAGVRAMGEIARGAGVDFSLGTTVRRAVDLERTATDLANSAYMPDAEGANGARRNPAEIIEAARRAANANAYAPQEALGGLQAFVGKTGDLSLGLQTLDELARLSRATGTSLDDMVSAAADAANQLPDTADKGAKLVAVMRAIAGQGKLGAVEIRDLATQMPKLVASAGMFGGKVEDNIAVLGALAQEARQRGGATSAAGAATSVAGFVNTLNTPARMKAFAAAGINLQGADGKLRNPEEVILEALAKRGNDRAGFKSLFANVQGGRAVEGFRTIYTQAGGGKAGLEAVAAEFDRLKKAAMGDGEVAESHTRAMQTSAAKVQLFENQLDEAGAAMAQRVIPELLKLAPVAVKAVDAIGSLASMAASSPMTAVTAALGASIAKAGVEQTVRIGIERIFAAGAGTPLAVGTMLVAAEAVAIEAALANQKDRTAGQVSADLRAENALARYRAETAGGGPASAATVEELRAAKAAAEQARSRGLGLGETILRGAATTVGAITGNDAALKQTDREAAQRQELTTVIGQLSDVLARIQSDGIHAKLPAGPGGVPGVTPAGRVGP